MKRTEVNMELGVAFLVEKEFGSVEDQRVHPALYSYYEVCVVINGTPMKFVRPVKSWVEYFHDKERESK